MCDKGGVGATMEVSALRMVVLARQLVYFIFVTLSSAETGVTSRTSTNGSVPDDKFVWYSGDRTCSRILFTVVVPRVIVDAVHFILLSTTMMMKDDEDTDEDDSAFLTSHSRCFLLTFAFKVFFIVVVVYILSETASAAALDVVPSNKKLLST